MYWMFVSGFLFGMAAMMGTSLWDDFGKKDRK